MRSSRCARSSGIAPERKTRTFRIIAGAIAARTPAERERAQKQGAKVADKLQHTGAAKVVVPRPLAAEGRARPRVHRVPAAQPQRPSAAARIAVPARRRRQVGQGHRARVQADLPDARRRARAQHADLPDRRRRAGDPDRRGDQARETDGVEYEKRLREVFAQQRRTLPQRPPNPKPEKPQKPDKPHTPAGGDDRIAALIRRHGGRFERRSSPRRGPRRSRSRCCARSIETETEFQNVFGSDNVANPIKSRGRPFLKVTKPLYQEYLRNRKKGLGQQGVGPMQLTTGSYQDRADKLGGCWKPGAEHHGRRAGAGGEDQRRRRRPAQRRQGLQQLEPGRRRTTPTSRDAALPQVAGAARRERRLRRRAGRGRSASAARRSAARTSSASSARSTQRLAAWKVDKRLRTDGRYGSDTANTARAVARGLGIPLRRSRTASVPRVQA